MWVTSFVPDLTVYAAIPVLLEETRDRAGERVHSSFTLRHRQSTLRCVWKLSFECYSTRRECLGGLIVCRPVKVCDGLIEVLPSR